MIPTETGHTRIEKRPDVCGGDACLRNTRYTVWGLVESRLMGLSDAQILANHADRTQADLDAAWEYYAAHRLEIEQAIWLNVADGFEYPDGVVPAAVLVHGRQLGIPDEEIRDTFDPPLPQSALDAAWAEYQRDPPRSSG